MVDTGMLGGLGGFAKGFAQAQMARLNTKRQDEQRKEMYDLQKRAMKEASDKRKFDLVREKRRESLQATFLPYIQEALGIPQGAGEAAKPGTTPIGASFSEGKEGGVAEKMALAQMDPMVSEMIKSIFDFDVPGAQAYAERRRHNIELEDAADRRISLQGQANELRRRSLEEGIGGFVESTIPGVGTVKTPYSKLGGLPPTLTKATEKEYAVKPPELPFWINPETMQRAQPGDSPATLKERGFIRISPAQLEKVQKLEAVKNIIDRVEVLMEQTIPKEEGAFGRLSGLGRGISAELQATETGQNLAVLRDYIMGNRAQVAKALGEVGNLSETEQAAVVKMFGAITDAGPKAWKQFELLKQTFDDSKGVAFGASKKQSKDKDLEDILFK